MKVTRRAILGSGLAASLLPVSASASETIYRYDALGRVAGVIHPNGSSSWYQYDSAGNRTSKRSGGNIQPNGFDADYYRLLYWDLFNANFTVQDAINHYNNNGWHEGRDPSAYFSTTGYLSAYPDVAAAGINPLDHYHIWGWHELRDPSPRFSTNGYRVNYPDITAANVDPHQHFVQNGLFEGRQPFGTGGFRPYP